MSVLVPALLVLLALLGVPLFVVIALGAIWGFYQSGVDLQIIAIEVYRLTEMPVLIAIALFTFSGYMLSQGGAPQRLLRLSNALLGWLPGGLAVVALISCALFTALTGASGITIIALGALLYPAMQKAGYTENFNLGLITSSGSLGLLFAPAVPLILYAVVAQQMSLGIQISIDDMFVAGILPGLLMLAALMAYSFFTAQKLPSLQTHTFSRQEAWQAIKESRFEIPLPFIILGGIYGGFFAVSEAAAITAMYVLLVSSVLRKEVSWWQLPEVLTRSMQLVGAIMLIVAVSLASTNYMIDSGVPEQIFIMLKEHISDVTSFLILLTLFLLILGMMLDIFSAIMLMVPLILPIALEFGVHPVHLGILFLANMQLGYFTPPVGMNLFIASLRFKKPVLRLYVATLPFFFILFICVLLITFIPWLSLVFL